MLTYPFFIVNPPQLMIACRLSLAGPSDWFLAEGYFSNRRDSGIKPNLWIFHVVSARMAPKNL